MCMICPVCHTQMRKYTKHYGCVHNHHFDIAKEGYTNVLQKSAKHTGDNKEMVNARKQFLHKGFYEPLLKELIHMLKSIEHTTVIDCGCGEGYYTNAIQKELHNAIYAFDLSKDALKSASKANDSVSYFLASIFDLPMRDSCADIVLNIFAPCPTKEVQRVLKEGSYLIKVDPNIHHLEEMKAVLYEDVKANEMKLISDFTLVEQKELNFTMVLENEDIPNLFRMTPYYYKSSQEASDKLQKLKRLECTASFIMYKYKKG